MSTLLDRLFGHAELTPDKPFIILWENGKYRIISYKHFLELSQSLAHYVATTATHDIEFDGVAFVVLRHGLKLHATFIACMLLGITPSYLPYPTLKQDPELYFSSHEKLFDRTQPKIIISYSDLIDPLRRIAPESTTIINIDDYIHLGYFSPPDLPVNCVTAILQHSSGTTGLKKGVQLTFAQIENQAEAYSEVIGLSPESVVVSWLPLYHDMGLLTSFLIPLHFGCAVVSLDAFDWVRDPTLLFKAIEFFAGTHVWLPNFAFGHIAKSAPDGSCYDLSTVRSFISCSEPVKPATIKLFCERFANSGVDPSKVQGCYAMAETVFAISQHSLGVPNKILAVDSSSLSLGNLRVVDNAADNLTVELASSGPPIRGMEVAILLPDGVIDARESSESIGEILVRGPSVFSGYFKNETQTNEAFLNGWYKTGDIGFVYLGEIYVCGRLKDLIIVHGRNYYSHDIEEVVLRNDRVIPGRAIAFGVYDEDVGSEELIIIAETNIDTGDTESQMQIRRDIKRSIYNSLEVTAKDVIFVEPKWLVKTTSGKLSRIENIRRYNRMLAKPLLGTENG